MSRSPALAPCLLLVACVLRLLTALAHSRPGLVLMALVRVPLVSWLLMLAMTRCCLCRSMVASLAGHGHHPGLRKIGLLVMMVGLWEERQALLAGSALYRLWIEPLASPLIGRWLLARS